MSARWLTAIAALAAAGAVAAGLVRRDRDRAYRRGVVNAQIAHTMALGEAGFWHAMQTPEARAQIERMESMTRLRRTEQP